MKYVVADENGNIVKSGANRASEAINWACEQVKGQASVKKIPETIKVVGDSPDGALYIANEDAARASGWKPKDRREVRAA